MLKKSEVIRWAIPILAVAVATLLRFAVNGWVGNRIPFSTYLLAVAFTAQFCGLLSALLATALSAVVSVYLFLPPYHSLYIQDPGDLISLAGFLVLAVTIAHLGFLMHRDRMRLQTTFDSSGVGMMEIDCNGRILAANQRVCEILRYSKQELLGRRKVHDLTHPDDMSECARLNDEMRQGKTSRFEYEKRYVAKDGSPVWGYVTVSAIRGLTGKWLRSVVTVQDIGERKRAEEAVARSEQRFRRIAEVSSEILWLANERGELIEDSPGWLKYTGMTPDQWKGWGWLEAVHPEDRDKVRETWKESLRTLTPYYCEFRQRHVSGSYRHAYSRAVPVLNDDGSVREWMGMNVDFHERKQAEEILKKNNELLERMVRLRTAELERSADNLRTKSAQLEAFFENTIAPLVFLDKSFNFIRVNAAFAAACRKSLEDFKGRNYFDLFPSAENAGIFHKVVSTKSPYVACARPFILPDHPELGTAFWDWIVAPVLDKDGEVDFLFFSAEDVTQRKSSEIEAEKHRDNLEQAVRERTKELLEADRRKDEFLAMLAHELRNPMSTISAASALLSRTAAAEQKTIVDSLARQTRQLAKLVDDLLDISRVIRGKVVLEREPLDFSEVIVRGVDVVRGEIERAKQTLTVVLADQVLPVSCDSVRLQQIVANLVSNAARYTPEGGQIHVRSFRMGETAVLEVRDSGEGIPQEYQNRIFEPFVQLNPGIHRSKGGLGIGLTVVKRLIELHGGSVSVASDGIGKGSVFTVQLPLLVQPSRQVELPSLAVKPGLQILVVDDNRDSAVLTSTLLESSGHRAFAANDGENGLRLALEKAPDVILLDIGLPKMDGYEVARRIRAAGNTHTLIIAVTGYGQEKDRRMSKEAGIDVHLLKPLEFDSLNSILADWQHGGRSRSSLERKQTMAAVGWH